MPADLSLLNGFMMAKQHAATQRLTPRAMSGDLSALNDLMAANPQQGAQVNQILQQRQQQAAMAQQQALENQLAQQNYGLDERKVILAENKALDPAGGDEFGLTPYKTVDDQGNIHLWQPSKGGAAPREIAVPKGQKVAAETPWDERAREAATKVDTAGKSASATKTAERDQEWVDKGVVAYDTLPDINRLVELNDAITTGGFASAATKAADLFGKTPADIGEFRTLQRTMVLSQLKQAFTGAISDAEREFLTSAQANIEQGGEVNKRTLSRLKSIAERNVNRGKEAAKRQGLSWDDYVGAEKSDASSPEIKTDNIKFLGFE